HPEHGIGHYRVDSPDRKPAPGMILRAERELGLDLACSILIGDKDSDIRAGIAAGVGRNVLFDPDAAASPSNRADFVVRSHREAAARLFPAAAAPAA
ncbi:MAG: HAD hydrolase-like protein, partial [Burkholderiaceae bacterium]